MLAWKPELADRNEIGGQFDVPVPVRVVVEKDNIELVKIMLPHIKDVNKVSFRSQSAPLRLAS